jgi:Tfp pilus assembly protein PilF
MKAFLIVPYSKHVKEDIMEKVKSLILAELFTSIGYIDRLIFAFTEIEQKHLTPSGKIQIQKLNQELDQFLVENFKDFDVTIEALDWEEIKIQLKTISNLIEQLLKVNFSSKKIENTALTYINIIYRNCYELHNSLNETSQLDIQYPKSGFLKEENILTINQHDYERAPLFYIDESEFYQGYELLKSNQNPLAFLQYKREEKYNHFMHKGHLSITNKEYSEASLFFKKARNYLETAEILTLIAWTHSLLDNRAEARTYCMMAIELDPQYGPAFNDYGNYLMADGQVKESLRWFELAKRAHHYLNREYPFINAGRAYVTLKEYDKALNEFSLALTLAPNHEELHETITKLKMSLEKSHKPNQHVDTSTNLNS